MSRLQSLKAATTKPELAKILNVKAKSLTYILYILKPENQYTQFKIPKKNGGERIINAPEKALKKSNHLYRNYY